MRQALEATYGTAGQIDSIRFGGLCDRAITRSLMVGAGIQEDVFWTGYPALIATMTGILTMQVESGDHSMQPCPGASALLARLAALPGVHLGLVTGNFQGTAFAKLRGAGLDTGLFPFGGYGHESEDRADLSRLAVERAAAYAGRPFAGAEVVVIGDTTNDIRCARAVGARAFSTLTGSDDRAAIEAANPDAVFDDLSDTDAVLAAILT